MVLTGTDAQIVRPYCRYTSDGFTTDAQIVRPYTGYTSRFDTTDARPSVPTTVIRPALIQRTLDRAFLQPLHVTLDG